MSVTIFHNPACSKSRNTLLLLEEQGIKPTIRLYLNDSPKAPELAKLMAMLGIDSARAMMRTGDKDYKSQHLDDEKLTNDDLIAAIVALPKLLERPIVVHQNQARIGRPPEQVLDIL